VPSAKEWPGTFLEYDRSMGTYALQTDISTFKNILKYRGKCCSRKESSTEYLQTWMELLGTRPFEKSIL
jgi:hypothetical protein